LSKAKQNIESKESNYQEVYGEKEKYKNKFSMMERKYEEDKEEYQKKKRNLEEEINSKTRELD